MAGYTRQSSASIINGADVTAPPLNAEFNKLRDAFDASSGHSHDGGAGNSPKINLATSVTGTLPATHGGSGGKNNFSATSAPTASDDTGDDYAIGSYWYNTSTTKLYVCTSATSSSAVWKEISLASSSGILTNVDIDSGTIDGTTIGANSPSTGVFTTLSASGTSTFATVDINGGNIDGTVVGASTPASITGTTITANTGFSGNLTGNVTGDLTGNVTGNVTGNLTGNVTGNITSSGTSTFTTVDINGGNIDGTVIGATSASSGSFTTVGTSGLATIAQADINSGTIDGAVIGGSSAQAITGTTITSTSGFSGGLTGNVTGNVTGNLTGNVTGDVTGDLTGNVTASSGTTTLNNIVVNGTADFTTTKLTNIVDPTDAQDGATKNYVDTNDALKLNLAGGTMSGAVAMATNKITGLGTPTNTADATTKGYVDTQVANLVDSAPGTLNTLNELAAALGDDPSYATTTATSIATKLPLAGGTMTGDITLGANKATSTATPATNDTLTRKGYVDTQDALKVTKAGDTMSGNLAMGTNKVTGVGDPTSAQDVATKTYVDTADATKLNLSGGTMSGAIAMGTNKITGVGDPTSAQDVATKFYIDDTFGSTVNAASSASNAATSETNAASSASAALASQNAAASSLATFQGQYHGPLSSAPTSGLNAGDLYFNTTSNKLNVYDGSNWLSTAEAAQRALTSHTVTSAGTQTISVTYTVGLIDIYLNGLHLAPADYSASNGSSVVITGCSVNDIIDIVALSAFNAANYGTVASKDIGIGTDNVPTFAANVADNDFLKIDGTTVEGRSATEVRSDLNVADGANNYVHPNHSGEVTSTADGATVIADDIVDEANLKVSNTPTDNHFLQAQSGDAGGLRWATVPAGYTDADVNTHLNQSSASSNQYLKWTGSDYAWSAVDLSSYLTISSAASTYASLAGATFTGDISGTNATLSGYLRGPSSFTIDPAVHGANSGTVIIKGDLQVEGTTTQVDSTTVNIADNLITLASGNTGNRFQADASGIEVKMTTEDNWFIKLIAEQNRWNISNDTQVTGNLYVIENSGGNGGDIALPVGTKNLYFNGNTGAYLRGYTSTTASNNTLKLNVNNQDNITLDGSQNSTFHGDVSIQGNNLLVGGNNAQPIIELFYDHSNGNDYKANMRLAGNDLEIRGSNGVIEFYTGAVDGDNSTLAVTIDSSNNSTFAGDIQAAGVYIGATNTSYDLYNNGSTYLNGTATVGTIQFNGQADCSINQFSNDLILRSHDDMYLQSKWIRLWNGPGSTNSTSGLNEYARISYTGNWFTGPMSFGGNNSGSSFGSSNNPGVAGQVLVSQGPTNAPTWANASGLSGVGGAWTTVSEIALSASNTASSSWQNFSLSVGEYYRFTFVDLGFTGHNDKIGMRFSPDGGASWQTMAGSRSNQQWSSSSWATSSQSTGTYYQTQYSDLISGSAFRLNTEILLFVHNGKGAVAMGQGMENGGANLPVRHQFKVSGFVWSTTNYVRFQPHNYGNHSTQAWTGFLKMERYVT